MTELYHPSGQSFVTWSYDISLIPLLTSWLRLPEANKNNRMFIEKYINETCMFFTRINDFSNGLKRQTISVKNQIYCITLLQVAILHILFFAIQCETVQATEWFPAADMATARKQHTATLLPNGHVLVVGGMIYPGDGSVGFLANSELYNPAANSWSTAANLIAARASHTATLLPDGRVLVAGGGYFPASAELYDPTANSWSPAGNMNIGRTFHSATLLSDGRVLVVGGSVLPGKPLATAELYDPAANNWSFAGNMESDRYGHSASLLANGRVLVAGGIAVTGYNSSQSIAASEVYDPSSNTWSSKASLAADRGGHSATLLTDGRVLVAGGARLLSYNGVTRVSSLDSAELYDPNRDTWSSANKLSHTRPNHSAILLPDSKVLVTGGGDAAELYDPSTNSWSFAGNMTEFRSANSATLLPNGCVLVAGGVGWGTIGLLASTELYGNPETQCKANFPWLILQPALNYNATILPTKN